MNINYILVTWFGHGSLPDSYFIGIFFVCTFTFMHFTLFHEFQTLYLILHGSGVTGIEMAVS